MGYAKQLPATGYGPDQALELAESENDDLYTPREAFNEEIAAWARRALAANGFGDY